MRAIARRTLNQFAERHEGPARRLVSHGEARDVRRTHNEAVSAVQRLLDRNPKKGTRAGIGRHGNCRMTIAPRRTRRARSCSTGVVTTALDK
jgi:hypothetical protein